MSALLHIIQNDPEVPPGNLLDHLAIPYTLHHPYRGDLLPEAGDIAALIVLGGAMGANDDALYPFLTELKTLVRSVVATGIPYLGICLGGQLLAAALGAEVVSGRWEELGALDVSLTSEGSNDRLFKAIAAEFKTFQWHHDSFDIPDDGVLLATSVECRHQAFRVGSSAWGVQFHPEVSEPIIRCWCAWSRSAAVKTDKMAADFVSIAEEYRATSCQLVTNFTQSCQL